ncbi:hypothetical protein QFZ91_004906 [Paraburkholderia sp. JPY419]
MRTCRACGVEPYAYLVHVLTELPQRAPDADISDLLPFNYAQRRVESELTHKTRVGRHVGAHSPNTIGNIAGQHRPARWGYSRAQNANDSAFGVLNLALTV